MEEIDKLILEAMNEVNKNYNEHITITSKWKPGDKTKGIVLHPSVSTIKDDSLTDDEKRARIVGKCTCTYPLIRNDGEEEYCGACGRLF